MCYIYSYFMFISEMAGGPVDPREILKGVENLLGKDGELRSLEGVPKVFRLELENDIVWTIMAYFFITVCFNPTLSVLTQFNEGFHQDGQ